MRIFGRFHYPNIKDKDKNAFLDELITLSSRFVASNPNVNDEMMNRLKEFGFWPLAIVT